MRILVTAFGPFGHFDRNPSELVLERVRERYEAAHGHVIDWRVLPVEFAEIDRLPGQIPDGAYDVIIHTGVDSGSKRPQVELCARNRVKGRDVGGIELDGLIDKTGPSLLSSPFASTLGEVLTTGSLSLAIDISDDAGKYLCNYVYYKSLRRFGSKSCVVFLHLADFLRVEDACGLEQQAEMLTRILDQLCSNSLNNHSSSSPMATPAV